jgi:hypothetical protein
VALPLPVLPEYDDSDPAQWFAKLSAWKERFRAMHEAECGGAYTSDVASGFPTATTSSSSTSSSSRELAVVTTAAADPLVSLAEISDLVAVLRGGQRFEAAAPINKPATTASARRGPFPVHVWLSGSDAAAHAPVLHLRDAGPGAGHRPDASIPLADASLTVGTRKRKAHAEPRTLSIAAPRAGLNLNLDAPDAGTCDIWCTSIAAVRDAVA